MTFKELKSGYPIYLLRKGGKVTATIANVISVTQPYMNTKCSVAQLVVDVVVSENGAETNYCVPEGSTVAQASADMFLYTDTSSLVSDVSLMRMQSESAIKSVENHKRIVEDCKAIEENFDANKKQKRENEERLSSIEKTLAEIQKQLLKQSKL